MDRPDIPSIGRQCKYCSISYREVDLVPILGGEGEMCYGCDDIFEDLSVVIDKLNLSE